MPITQYHEEEEPLRKKAAAAPTAQVQRKLALISRNNKLDADQRLYYKKLYLAWIRYIDFEGGEAPPTGILKADALYYSGQLHR